MPSLEESFPTLVGLEPDQADPVRELRTRAETFESLLRVAITRASKNVRATTVLESLDRVGFVEPSALAAAQPMELVDALGESGTRLSPREAQILTRLARWFVSRFPEHNELTDLDAVPTSTLRDELSSLNGVGQATADTIVLHGLGRAAYPVDRGTYRVLVRHGWIDVTAEYDEVGQLLLRHSGERPDVLARLSRGLVEVARLYCKVGSPRCTRCPLRGVLPEDGPREPEA
jgi:endonuclease-3 related protein